MLGRMLAVANQIAVDQGSPTGFGPSSLTQAASAGREVMHYMHIVAGRSRSGRCPAVVFRRFKWVPSAFGIG